MAIKGREQGPVEILCDEIGAVFTKNMENGPVFVSFIRGLVGEVEDMVKIESHLSSLTGKEIPAETGEAIDRVKKLLDISDREGLIAAASEAHGSVHVSDYGPCNHYIDMLSSCVSAIRFGLEQPCRSRHAAEAANHVWKHKYRIGLFDKHSNDWGRQWAKIKFYEALADVTP